MTMHRKLLTAAESKYTPGPWYRNIPPANKYATVWSGRNKHVAYIKQMPDDDEAEANINLIAAAPAMYEALQAIEARLQGNFDHPALIKHGMLTHDKEADVLRFARAAIAQAKGNTQRGTPCAT